MRKLLPILFFAICLFPAEAQKSTLKDIFVMGKFDVNQKHKPQRVKNSVWLVTFDEATPSWTFGSTMGNVAWEIGDDASRPCYWGPVNGDGSGWYVWSMDEVYEAYELGTPGSYAFIDIMGHRSTPPATLPVGCTWSGTGIEPYNAFMTFEDLDFSDVEFPVLTFVHSGVVFNIDHFDFFVEYSIDDGSTWTSFSIVDADDIDAEMYFYGPVELGLPGLAGQGNVDLRFRHDSKVFIESDFENFGISRGWLIDDIQVCDYAESGPAYDISLYDSRINFFEYRDYTNPQNEGVYHVSSYYGQIPQDQFYTGVLFFNVSVENKGTQTVTTSTRIKVENPNGTEIYNQVVVGATIAFAVKDTIDIVDNVCTIEDPIVGKYMVYFEAFIEGQVDEDPIDNCDTAYFYISPTTFSREAFDINDNVSPKEWIIGGQDDDGVGTTFLVNYEASIQSVDLFISSASFLGTQFYVEIRGYNELDEGWTELLLASEMYTVGTNTWDSWFRVLFSDDYSIELEDQNEGKKLLVGVKMRFNGEYNDFLLGESKCNQHSEYGTYWFFNGESDPQWRNMRNYRGGAPAIRLNLEPQSSDAKAYLETNIQIFPNPTRNLLSVANVGNVSFIEIKDINGRTVLISNCNLQLIDVSPLVSGLYFVYITTESGTVIRKFVKH